MSPPSASEVELYQRLMDLLHDASRLAFRMGMSRTDLQGLQWKAAVDMQERMTRELLHETAALKRPAEVAKDASKSAPEAPPVANCEDGAQGLKNAPRTPRDAR